MSRAGSVGWTGPTLGASRGGRRVRAAQQLVGDAARLAQPAQEGPVNRGGVVAHRVLPYGWKTENYIS